jgi:YD repeat-containing protein
VTTGYTHDPAGEVASVTDGAQNTTNYSYDSLGRLVLFGVVRRGGKALLWSGP